MFTVEIQTFHVRLRSCNGQSPTLMKVLTTFSLLLFSTSSFAQHLALASTSEPTILYVRANESLSVGDTRNATTIFKQVIDFYQNEGRVKEVSESYLGMALAFAFNGHYAESIRFHRKALRAHHRYRCNESDDAIRLNLGLTYQLAGKERRAKRLLQG
jgi:hypothetical protein